MVYVWVRGGVIALLGMNGGEEVLDRVRHFMFIISSSESCSSIVLPQAVQQRTCYSDSRTSAYISTARYCHKLCNREHVTVIVELVNTYPLPGSY